MEPNPQTPSNPAEYRTGFGYDVHRLVEGRPLILGGVEVPHEKGLEGHSDADVLLHALTDAVLGAAGLGDIGSYFPSSDPTIKGISSLRMLDVAMERVRAAGWRVVNVDGTIVAQKPRLSPHTPRMRGVIAEHLGVSEDRVNVKSKTTDGLGFAGTEEGMAAYCAAMLSR